MAEIITANSVVIKPSDMDVYETADLPEDDQHEQIVIKGEQAQSDCVEPIGVSVQQAFAQFQNKTLGANDVDFSDDISRVRCSGYSADSAALASSYGVGDESLEQKCQRLQLELRQLAKEMELLKESGKAEASVTSLAPMELANQIDYLRRQMIDLAAENQLGISSSIDPKEALQRRLLTELNGFHKPSSKPSVVTKSAPPAAGHDADHVNYQLFYRPEQAKFCNNARIADFEQRIERLEAVLGQNPEKLALLTSELSNKTLLGALSLLSAKMKVLDPSYLDIMEPRLASVYHRVSRSADHRQAGDQTERLNKISALYETVKKWDSMANAVPHIVDRLTVLKEGQQQALQMNETLANLDLSQRQMINELSEETAMLKQFQGLMGDSSAKMESNSRNIEERVKTAEGK